uniref:Uncharacterized protein n=1 Tax=Parascaris univalens TaxID=6257 RepID=A0A915BTS3_PARUN
KKTARIYFKSLHEKDVEDIVHRFCKRSSEIKEVNATVGFIATVFLFLATAMKCPQGYNEYYYEQVKYCMKAVCRLFIF